MTNSTVISPSRASRVLGFDDEANILSPKEAGRILGISDETVRKKVHNGEIKGTIYPGKGEQGRSIKYILIPMDSIKTYLKKTITPTALSLLTEN